MRKTFLFLITFFALLKPLFSQDFKPYLGETPPDTIAQLFGEGIISTGIDERDMAMTPDMKEIYWAATIGVASYSTILFSKYDGKEWSKPEIAPFAKDLNYKFVEPAISHDGSKFYFVSDMKASAKDTSMGGYDIWVMNREDESWAEPYNLGSPINTSGPEFFPSIANSGNLYFTRDNPDGTSSIFVSKLKDGKYQDPVLLPEEINAGRSRFNAMIARDESYIITPTFGLPDSYGGTDYYISFNQNGKWIGPFNMGSQINSDSRKEWSAYVSPDDKYIFFMSSQKKNSEEELKNLNYNEFIKLADKPENGNNDIYWISNDIIQKLKWKHLAN